MQLQPGKLKIFGTRPNWVDSYVAYTKFHLPRLVFYSSGQIVTHIGERASTSFPAFPELHLSCTNLSTWNLQINIPYFTLIGELLSAYFEVWELNHQEIEHVNLETQSLYCIAVQLSLVPDCLVTLSECSRKCHGRVGSACWGWRPLRLPCDCPRRCPCAAHLPVGPQWRSCPSIWPHRWCWRAQPGSWGRGQGLPCAPSPTGRGFQ